MYIPVAYRLVSERGGAEVGQAELNLLVSIARDLFLVNILTKRNTVAERSPRTEIYLKINSNSPSGTLTSPREI
jgi:hypothetical protein